VTGPSPKDPSTRQRRNTTSTKSTLRKPVNPFIPELPATAGFDRLADQEVQWAPETEEWWLAVWESPMAPEFDDSDYFGLVALAWLWNMRELAMAAGHVKTVLDLTTEIRLQQPKYGLTPDDRRRLQWTIEQGEQAGERTQSRHLDEQDTNRGAPEPPKAPVNDPRHGLYAV